jgi:hypothetical protein
MKARNHTQRQDDTQRTNPYISPSSSSPSSCPSSISSTLTSLPSNLFPPALLLSPDPTCLPSPTIHISQAPLPPSDINKKSKRHHGSPESQLKEEDDPADNQSLQEPQDLQACHKGRKEYQDAGQVWRLVEDIAGVGRCCIHGRVHRRKIGREVG